MSHIPTVRPKRASTRMEQGFEEARLKGGGIQANAHPEFNNPTPLDMVVSAGKKAVSAVQKAFKKRSPSHIAGD